MREGPAEPIEPSGEAEANQFWSRCNLHSDNHNRASSGLDHILHILRLHDVHTASRAALGGLRVWLTIGPAVFFGPCTIVWSSVRSSSTNHAHDRSSDIFHDS